MKKAIVWFDLSHWPGLTGVPTRVTLHAASASVTYDEACRKTTLNFTDESDSIVAQFDWEGIVGWAWE